MINATLMNYDGEVFHQWSGPTLYDIIGELNRFLREGDTGVAFAVTLSSSELKTQVAKELDGAILQLGITHMG